MGQRSFPVALARGPATVRTSPPLQIFSRSHPLLGASCINIMYWILGAGCTFVNVANMEGMLHVSRAGLRETQISPRGLLVELTDATVAATPRGGPTTSICRSYANSFKKIQD